MNDLSMTEGFKADTDADAKTNASEAAVDATPEDTVRKPRIAIMGEFSGGKSTLSNLLLGARPLPERVTATRMAPVWLTEGNADPVAVSVDGSEADVSFDVLEDLDLEVTRYIRLAFDSPILSHCDLIDFPGISDPNMDSEVWERMLPEVDMVLWCTHATQAWRQSESAAWNLVPAEVRARSMLLVTQFDKLTSDRDRARVLNRIKAETADLFSGVYPMALLQALAATSDADADAWAQSGAKAFAVDLYAFLEPETPGEEGGASGDTPASQSTGADGGAQGASDPTTPTAPATPETRVIPRRIRAASAARRARPEA